MNCIRNFLRVQHNCVILMKKDCLYIHGYDAGIYLILLPLVRG